MFSSHTDFDSLKEGKYEKNEQNREGKRIKDREQKLLSISEDFIRVCMVGIFWLLQHKA